MNRRMLVSGHIKAELFVALRLGRGLGAEHPYLVATLLQPRRDARDVTPDAAGAHGQ
jgi:hypothetical protein